MSAVYDILFDCLYKHKMLKSLLPMLSVAAYQIVAEKEKRAPFVMANDVLYRKHRFMETFYEHDEMLARNYGHKIFWDIFWRKMIKTEQFTRIIE